MIIQQRRSVFETNSSSMHSIAISKRELNEAERFLLEREYGCLLTLESKSFGSYHAIYYDIHDKLMYLLEAFANFPKTFDSNMKKLEDFCKKVNINLDLPVLEDEVVSFNGEDERRITWKNSEDEYGSYIDHGYALDKFVDDIMNDEELLKQYLLSNDSCIETGNDYSTDFKYRKSNKDFKVYIKGN